MIIEMLRCIKAITQTKIAMEHSTSQLKEESP